MKTNNYLFINSKLLDQFLQYYSPDGEVYSNIGVYSFEDTVFFDNSFNGTLSMLIMVYGELFNNAFHYKCDRLLDRYKLIKHPPMYLLIIKIKLSYLDDKKFARYFYDLLKNSHVYNLHIFIVSHETLQIRTLKMINFYVYGYKTQIDSILNIFTVDDTANFKKNFYKMKPDDYLIITNNQYHFFPCPRNNNIDFDNLTITI